MPSFYSKSFKRLPGGRRAGCKWQTRRSLRLRAILLRLEEPRMRMREGGVSTEPIARGVTLHRLLFPSMLFRSSWRMLGARVACSVFANARSRRPRSFRFAIHALFEIFTLGGYRIDRMDTAFAPRKTFCSIFLSCPIV